MPALASRSGELDRSATLSTQRSPQTPTSLDHSHTPTVDTMRLASYSSKLLEGKLSGPTFELTARHIAALSLQVSLGVKDLSKDLLGSVRMPPSKGANRAPFLPLPHSSFSSLPSSILFCSYSDKAVRGRAVPFVRKTPPQNKSVGKYVAHIIPNAHLPQGHASRSIRRRSSFE